MTRKEVTITIKLRTDSDGDTDGVREFVDGLSILLDYTVFDAPRIVAVDVADYRPESPAERRSVPARDDDYGQGAADA